MMARMGPGGVLGDVICGSRSRKSLVTVVAATPVQALWIPYARVLSGGGSPAHILFLQNLIALLADKYFRWTAGWSLMACTLREKILRYLTAEAGPDSVCVTPFTRAQLAAYLGCDRSALCRSCPACKGRSFGSARPHVSACSELINQKAAGLPYGLTGRLFFNRMLP